LSENRGQRGFILHIANNGLRRPGRDHASRKAGKTARNRCRARVHASSKSGTKTSTGGGEATPETRTTGIRSLLTQTARKCAHTSTHCAAQSTAERVAARGPGKTGTNEAATGDISHRAGEASKLAKLTA
jgi:hypothetical protein